MGGFLIGLENKLTCPTKELIKKKRTKLIRSAEAELKTISIASGAFIWIKDWG